MRLFPVQRGASPRPPNRAPPMQKPVDKATNPQDPLFKVENPEEMAQNMFRLVEEGGKVMSGLLDRTDGQAGPYSAASEVTQATQAFTEVAQHWMMNDPGRLAEAQTRLAQGYMEIWNNTLKRMMGEETPAVVQPEPGDNRFKDPEWQSNPYFDFWKQTYLLTMRWAEKTLAETEGLDDRTRARADFYLRQVSSALSPTNFPFTNPEVVRETLKSNARNLVEGMHHLADDLERSDDLLKISQTDLSAFEVGRNLAVTPGKVIAQNEIHQLIQYTPTTETVHERPLLIVPPWINKFYIMDLTAQKSLIRYLVSKGFTVFVISWVNPDANLSHKTFEDYMYEGVLAAADAVRRETGQRQVNALGYCVGGTMLATTLAYEAAIGDSRFASATFLTTQTDFTRAGDLSLFVDDSQLAALQEMMRERGFLDGSRMATVFNMLRPRDLIWPYIVNNYLLGKKPMPFDLLYWNQDSTRMTAANHSFYLGEFYKDNKLAQGELVISGIKMDLGKITIPIFELAAKEDHIAPAKSVFIGAKKFGGPVEYVLAGSGHIAGVINPPDKVKYQYWTNRDLSPATLDEWIGRAKETPGSWWPHWIEWLSGQSGAYVPARTPGARLGVIEDAPGSYVKVRS